ncbi:hypothetical protein OK016_07460 [Vibrio chagasii]|nr:hypothetical protein [Vibrio chagasii]
MRCSPSAVGSSQKQHLELARDIATRFNNIYSPEQPIFEIAARTVHPTVNACNEPTRCMPKMSKSDDNP